MLKSLSIFLLLAATSVFAVPPTMSDFSCGAVIPDSELREAEAHFQSAKVVPTAGKVSTVNVYWHVISQDNTPAGGNVPDSKIQEQINVMNRDYAPTGITWKLAGITRSLNPYGFNNIIIGGSEQTKMKNALRLGGPGDLNVYSTNLISDGGQGSLYGYATFPYQYNAAPKDDGIVLYYQTLPGGTAPGTNLGRILVHEAGHWVGLYHTFQGGCSDQGDLVADTPAEASPARGCPTSPVRDTCTGYPGADPIHNHMDYTDDACRTTFTPGQIQRLSAQITTYRGL